MPRTNRVQSAKARSISVGYGKRNAIQGAINGNKFARKGVYVALDWIPLGGQGQSVEEVREVCFGQDVLNCNLHTRLEAKGREQGFKLGFKCANPLTALLYVKKFPQKQLKKRLGILFHDIYGNPCVLEFDKFEGGLVVKGGRSMSMYFTDFKNCTWCEDDIFLVVPVQTA